MRNVDALDNFKLVYAGIFFSYLVSDIVKLFSGSGLSFTNGNKGMQFTILSFLAVVLCSENDWLAGALRMM